MTAPIPMILHCPNCGLQHIDKANFWADENAPCDPPNDMMCPDGAAECDKLLKAYEAEWTNPPHRSHLCHGCGTIWRPADVATTGVAYIETRGKADNFAAQTNAQFEVTRNAARWRGFVKACTTDDESFVDMLEEADPETPEEFNAAMDRWLAQQQ